MKALVSEGEESPRGEAPKARAAELFPSAREAKWRTTPVLVPPSLSMALTLLHPHRVERRRDNEPRRPLRRNPVPSVAPVLRASLQQRPTILMMMNQWSLRLPPHDHPAKQTAPPPTHGTPGAMVVGAGSKEEEEIRRAAEPTEAKDAGVRPEPPSGSDVGSHRSL